MAVGLVNISNAMSSEMIESDNFPSHEELDNITGEIFYYVTSPLIEKCKPLSVDEAKIALFEIHERTVKKLKSRGFDVKGKESFPKKQEDISDEDARLFLSELEN